MKSNRLLCGFLLVHVLLAAGCERGRDWRKPRAPEVSAAAAGAGFDVEYLFPDRFVDLPEFEKLYFAVKFVCGEADKDDPLVPANYKTVINVMNLSRLSIGIEWVISTVDETVTDNEAVVPGPNGSFAMDCDSILGSLAAAGADVSGLTEGFVLIEDPVRTKALRVAAVYSTLHKQLHDRPDLIPVEKDETYCTLDGQDRLLVTIRNIGEARAEASTTEIVFPGSAAIERDTAILEPGDEAPLAPIDIPIGGDGTITFEITADSLGQITESNEFNNKAIGFCAIVD